MNENYLKQCKECNIKKELSEFYNHPQWVLWTLPRCKECIKSWRKTDREREMARIIDKKRVRPEWYIYKMTKKYRVENKEKYEAHKKVWNYLRNHKQEYIFKCCICWNMEYIELHHEDYSKPNEVIPMCTLHHKGYHYWKNWINLDKKIILPF